MHTAPFFFYYYVADCLARLSCLWLIRFVIYWPKRVAVPTYLCDLWFHSGEEKLLLAVLPIRSNQGVVPLPSITSSIMVER